MLLDFLRLEYLLRLVIFCTIYTDMTSCKSYARWCGSCEKWLDKSAFSDVALNHRSVEERKCQRCLDSVQCVACKQWLDEDKFADGIQQVRIAARKCTSCLDSRRC